jgi:ABC-2 type transport system ATP-binding protein
MIELLRFSKCYGQLTAVSELNLKINAGEVFGFIGPNGAGKSTTIRFLATLLKATSGDAIINGHRVRKNPLAVRRNIGFMPDTFGVYSGMSVEDFLGFFAAASRISRQARKPAVDRVLEMVGLSDRRKQKAASLSRGMKQRLCLAKTLVHDPPVLILDEPANGLDPRARIELKKLLGDLRQAGKTILISSHILSELADCCTSVGIIDRGRLLACGSIDQIYQKIRHNRTVAIKFLSNQDIGLKILENRPETRRIQVHDHCATVELAADDGQMADLMEQLLSAGARMYSFAEQDPTLEDVFLTITQVNGA